MDIAPVRPSKQQQQQQRVEEPQKENKKPALESAAAEDFPSLGELLTDFVLVFYVGLQKSLRKSYFSFLFKLFTRNIGT